MAQIRKTTYVCDSCGEEVGAKKELRTVQLVPKTGSGYDYNRAVRTELCSPCEEKFVEAVVPFVPDDAASVIESYRREK